MEMHSIPFPLVLYRHVHTVSTKQLSFIKPSIHCTSAECLARFVSSKLVFNIHENIAGEPTSFCSCLFQVNCLPSQVKATNSWLFSLTSMVKNAAVKSVTGKNLAQCKICNKMVDRSGTGGCGTNTCTLIFL